MTDRRLGIVLMIFASFLLGWQDAISRVLSDEYNVILITMLRYWFLGAVIIVIFSQRKGGLRRPMQSRTLKLQIVRGVLLAFEICVMVTAFVLLGLVESHAIFAVYPLLITALSGPALGEKVGPRRWTAIAVGFVGVVIILRPGLRVFSPEALIALATAFLFAVYGLLTRYVSRYDDAETSFFWTGIAGMVAITLTAPFSWEPIAQEHWGWMLLLSCLAALAHFLLIKAYASAEASVIQPFAYFQLVFASAIAVIFLDETLDPLTVLGAGIVVAAGLYTIWRERQVAGSKP
jgi:drug/metabolite transporter (DMT)-like permease